MRVAMISTYPPIECGIGTYTNFLVQALLKTHNEIHVVSQNGAEGYHVYPTYNPKEKGIAAQIYDMVIKITPDIVHIQHEYGLFGELNGIAVLELIYRIKSTGMPVIATFHTVLEKPEFRMELIFRTMCRDLDGIIVHEKEHVGILKKIFDTDPSKIFLIPHGARDIETIKDAKQKLDLERKKVILMAGYFRPTKCFDRIVDLFPRVLEKVPDAWLVISGKLRILEYSTYRSFLFEKINASSAIDRIEVFRGQFPQYTFDTIINAADIMVFPYSAGAQSGMIAHALTFGKPIVTSDLPAFINIVEKSGAGFAAGAEDEYVNKIVELLTNDSIYQKCSQNALRYVKEKIPWGMVAGATLEVYKKFDQNLECKTRYIFFGQVKETN